MDATITLRGHPLLVFLYSCIIPVTFIIQLQPMRVAYYIHDISIAVQLDLRPWIHSVPDMVMMKDGLDKVRLTRRLVHSSWRFPLDEDPSESVKNILKLVKITGLWIQTSSMNSSTLLRMSYDMSISATGFDFLRLALLTGLELFLCYACLGEVVLFFVKFEAKVICDCEGEHLPLKWGGGDD